MSSNKEYKWCGLCQDATPRKRGMEPQSGNWWWTNVHYYLCDTHAAYRTEYYIWVDMVKFDFIRPLDDYIYFEYFGDDVLTEQDVFDFHPMYELASSIARC